MKLFKALAASTLLVVATPVFAQEQLSIATGGTGGVYFPMGGGLAEIINGKIDGYSATAEVTGASVENMGLVATGDADMAIALADTVQQGYTGTGRFEGNALQMVRECIARIQREENLLIFPEGTRTTGLQVKNLKRGFACIAIKARVPLVVIRVTSFNEAFMRKGHPFFSVSPRIPMRYRFENLGEIIPNCRDSSRCLTDRVEHMMRGVL